MQGRALAVYGHISARSHKRAVQFDRPGKGKAHSIYEHDGVSSRTAEKLDELREGERALVESKCLQGRDNAHTRAQRSVDECELVLIASLAASWSAGRCACSSKLLHALWPSRQRKAS
ncbi:hypothetical protein CBOM_07422 [Ceraceosorus bombacis]|uniref:Uncharacterized protein n=1 Tax=Ceraceosorus bombacis TaxID=401625 RepID=A0A0P1BDM4_9BASI|nr:hypothetical protein CBOM_07422 [Ceraceosorus bombacis]